MGDATIAAIWHSAFKAFDHDGEGERDDAAAIADLKQSLMSRFWIAASDEQLRAQTIRILDAHEFGDIEGAMSALEDVFAERSKP